MTDPNTLQCDILSLPEVIANSKKLQESIIRSKLLSFDEVYNYEDSINNKVRVCCKDLLDKCGITDPNVIDTLLRKTRSSDNPYDDIENADEVYNSLKS